MNKTDVKDFFLIMGGLIVAVITVVFLVIMIAFVSLYLQLYATNFDQQQNKIIHRECIKKLCAKRIK